MEENTQLDTNTTETNTQTTESATNTSKVDDNKTFSQSELDAIITKRLEREKKNWQANLDEEQRKANLTEVERLKAEKDEALNKATEKMKNANEKLFKADFKQVANELGIVDFEIAEMLIEKTDLQDEDGNVNVAELKTALETLIAKKPYLKVQQQQIANLPGSPSFKTTGVLTKEQLSKMSAKQIANLSEEVINQALKN